MGSFFKLLVCSLAVLQFVDIARHSRLGRPMRLWMNPKVWPPRVRRAVVYRWISHLWGCGFCLAVNAGLLAVAVWEFPVGRWFLSGLAASRLAGYLNDLTKDRWLMPRANDYDVVIPYERRQAWKQGSLAATKDSNAAETHRATSTESGGIPGDKPFENEGPPAPS